MVYNDDTTGIVQRLHLVTSPFLSLCLGASDDWVSAHRNRWNNREMATVSPQFFRGSVNQIRTRGCRIRVNSTLHRTFV